MSCADGRRCGKVHYGLDRSRQFAISDGVYEYRDGKHGTGGPRSQKPVRAVGRARHASQQRDHLRILNTRKRCRIAAVAKWIPKASYRSQASNSQLSAISLPIVGVFVGLVLPIRSRDIPWRTNGGCGNANRIIREMLVADPARVQTRLNPGGPSYRKVDVILTRCRIAFLHPRMARMPSSTTLEGSFVLNS